MIFYIYLKHKLSTSNARLQSSVIISWLSFRWLRMVISQQWCYSIFDSCFDKFLENFKNREKQQKSKIIRFFIYLHRFLAFLASSQKNLNFQRSLERVQFLTSFLKSLIFLIESMLILLVFKKYKKNQNLQKKKTWGTKFET